MTSYHARWICPIASPPIRDGTVVQHDGRITYVGPRRDAPSDDQDVHLGDAILIPGLVNAHCHLELTAMRGFLDGLGFQEWIARLTAGRRAVLSDEMLLDAARFGVDEGLQHGITTFADTGDTGAGFDAMLERGVRGICYREVFGPDPAQCDDAISLLRAKVIAMRERATALVSVGVSPHAPYTVSDALFRATTALARDNALPLAVHIAESELESELVERGSGALANALRARGIPVGTRARSPIALLDVLGVLDVRPLLIHCVQVDEEDIRAIARHDCAVAHCPASNAKLGHGIAPLVHLLDAGIRVGLGTDSVASNDRMDLVDEARLATLLAASRERRHDALTASDALRLATIGGAQALGLDGEIGTLEMGKAADLTAFRVPPHRAPVHDPVAALVYSLAGMRADFVAVAGRVRVRGGKLVDADEGLSRRVQHSADLLQHWLAGSRVVR
jgi:cytosine/adenosine deaminase-related metal-dependent hydrolase